MTIAAPPQPQPLPLPLPGRPEALGPGLRRILAPNPSPMTLHGTNTYLVGTRDLAVIDPGPDDPRHLAAILHALRPGEKISHIFVTHAHLDHSPLARRLAAECGAPVLAYGDASAGRSETMQALAQDGLTDGGEGVDRSFRPDIELKDGEMIRGPDWALRSYWTPGHFGNHICLAWGGTVFSGDLVMGWASSLVSPPDGDLTDFMASCRRLRRLGATVLHAGHGPPIEDPVARIDALLAHRQGREATIIEALDEGAATAAELTARIYTDTPKALHPAAERNVLAHLIDLHRRDIARADGQLRSDTPFHLLQRNQ